MPSPMITITGTEALTRRLLELGADAPKAGTRAVNRTLATVATATVRALATEVGLAQKDIRPSITAQRATFTRQIGTLRVTGRRIPLIAFGARGPEPSRGRGSGVTYKLPGGRGRLPEAFIATMRSGHRGVFVRRTGASSRRVGRLPILELYGPSLPGAMVRKGIDAAMVAVGDEALARNLDHEINWIISQRVPAGDA